MPPNEKEVADDLYERQLADRVLDRFGSQRVRYQEFQDHISEVYSVYRNDWSMTWPDGRTERVDPSVPNLVRVAAEDRARAAASTPPSIVCTPDGPGDEAREYADKMERIASGWLARNTIRGHTTQMWAHDAMSSGLTACKVMPDFTKPVGERYPIFTRLEPALSYPDPVFTAGPFVESFIYSYEAPRREIEWRYGVTLAWPTTKGSDTKIQVIEYHDEEWSMIVVQQTTGAQNQRKRETIMQERHGLGRCPVVIGSRPTMDGTYSGEFIGGLGVLDYWNKLMTLVMDDAVRKVYPERVTYNVLNPNDYGPDANIELETPDGKYEYVQQGNQAFSNLQILRDVNQSVRSSFLISAARSGDPNESIISAAGVGAVDGQRTEDVRSIQRDILAPMLTAAIEVARLGDVKWANTSKPVSPFGTREMYKPGDDIVESPAVEVRYGAASGLDEINQNVMVLQQLGARIIDRRTAMEMSPFVEDPQRVEKRMLQETMQDAMLAGLAAQAQQGAIDPVRLALITQAVESDEVTLSEAIAALAPQAPLAAPQQTSPGAPPEAPGIAGAAEGPQPSNMPTMMDLMGAQ